MYMAFPETAMSLHCIATVYMGNSGILRSVSYTIFALKKGVILRWILNDSTGPITTNNMSLHGGGIVDIRYRKAHRKQNGKQVAVWVKCDYACVPITTAVLESLIVQCLMCPLSVRRQGFDSRPCPNTDSKMGWFLWTRWPVKVGSWR